MDKYKMIKEIMNSDLKEETKRELIKELMEQPIIINYPTMQQPSQPWQITYTDKTDDSYILYSRG